MVTNSSPLSLPPVKVRLVSIGFGIEEFNSRANKFILDSLGFSLFTLNSSEIIE